jgi:hypothetical protein
VSTEEQLIGASVAVARPLTIRAASRNNVWVARVALLMLVAIVGMVALAAAHTAVLLPATVRPLPSWLAGPLGHLNVDVGLAGTIGLLAALFAAYLWVLHAHRALSTRAVIAAILVVHLIVALAPPLFSTDVFSYASYARMGALYGLNPYLAGPESVLLDHWYPFVGADWVTTPSAYGPLFTLLGYPIAGLNILWGVTAYKWLAATASLAAVAGVWHCAGRLGRDRLSAVVLIGLNPALLIYAVGGAHNDMVMLAPLVAGIAAILSRRERVGGTLLVAATAIKVTAGVVLPFALAAHDNPFRIRERRVLLGACVAGVIISAASAVAFGIGPLRLLGTLEQIQRHGGSQSIVGFIPFVLGDKSVSIHDATILAGTCVVAVIGLLLAVRRGRLDWLTGAGWAFVAMLITTAYLLPWYTTWCLPFAALTRDRRLRWTAIVLSAIALTSL